MAAMSGEFCEEEKGQHRLPNGIGKGGRDGRGGGVLYPPPPLAIIREVLSEATSISTAMAGAELLPDTVDCLISA